jgi:hypothetical protein
LTLSRYELVNTAESGDKTSNLPFIRLIAGIISVGVAFSRVEKYLRSENRFHDINVDEYVADASDDGLKKNGNLSP